MRRHGGYAVNFDAPLPLGFRAAVDRAEKLRNANPRIWTWDTISEVMRLYHGVDRCETWWRRELRGRVEARPRGNAWLAGVARIER